MIPLLSTAPSTATLAMCTAVLVLGAVALAPRFAPQGAQDDAPTQALVRARAASGQGEVEAAAAIARRALERETNAEAGAELRKELEQWDPLHRPTAEIRRTHTAALLELAAADRAAGFSRVGAAMEVLAGELDAAHVAAALGTAAPERAGADDLARYFAEPDLLPAGLSYAIEGGELRLKPSSGALAECLGERPPRAFLLHAEAHHEGDQATFGFELDVRDQNDFLRAELVWRDGKIMPRLTAHSATSGPLAKEGPRTSWNAAGSEWIAIEIAFDGELATLRVGTNGEKIELRVPPKAGAGRLGVFCEAGLADMRTRFRNLRVRELEKAR